VGFEPLPILVDQRHQRDRNLKRVGEQPGESVKPLLTFGVENTQRQQIQQAFLLEPRQYHQWINCHSDGLRTCTQDSPLSCGDQPGDSDVAQQAMLPTSRAVHRPTVDEPWKNRNKFNIRRRIEDSFPWLPGSAHFA
jgi:hypothetical protein